VIKALLVQCIVLVACGVVSADVVRGVVFHDANGNGVLDTRERGLKGVGVSNGLEVVETDRKGKYELPVGDDTILFVIKPSGWITALNDDGISQGYYIHKPAGSPKTEYPGVDPTGPLPESVDFPMVRHSESDQFDLLLFGDPQPYDEDGVIHYGHDVVEELVGSDALFGITLGDMVEDRLDLLDDINTITARIGAPWHYVMGNHDMNMDTTTDELADETFERIYGPPYYSFNYGKMHCIVLDSVHRTGKKIRPELGARQLAFIENDLARVPDDRLVVLTMHIPVVDFRDRDALYAIVQDRSHLFMIAAHWHSIEQFFLGSDDGWHGEKPLHLYVAGATCGSFWTGFRDAAGIPHSTMSDGSPNGYSVMSVDGNDYTFRYKAARRPADYQMAITAPEAVAASQAAETEIVANVFVASERAKVEMRLGEDGAWTSMTRWRGFDPFAVAFFKREKERDPKEASWGKPKEQNHLYRGYLPANPPAGMTVIYVRAVDTFGFKHSGRRLIRIE
jgi:hypothetical protein